MQNPANFILSFRTEFWKNNTKFQLVYFFHLLLFWYLKSNENNETEIEW